MLQLYIFSILSLRTCGTGRRSKPYHQSHTIKGAIAGHWNDVYTPVDDISRLKWPRRETEVMTEIRGGIYLTKEPHGEEPVEIVMNDQLFYHAGELAIPARPDAGVDMRHGPSEPGPNPDNGGDANEKNHGKMTPWKGRMTE